jgi:hypothetical protein
MSFSRGGTEIAVVFAEKRTRSCGASSRRIQASNSSPQRQPCHQSNHYDAQNQPEANDDNVIRRVIAFRRSGGVNIRATVVAVHDHRHGHLAGLRCGEPHGNTSTRGCDVTWLTSGVRGWRLSDGANDEGAGFGAQHEALAKGVDGPTTEAVA